MLILSKAVGFFILIVIIGKWVFPSSKGLIKMIPVIGWFDLRKFISMGHGEYMILALLLIAVSVGLLAHFFGFHPAIGAYMAGLVIHRDYFDFNKENEINYFKQANDIIDNMAFTWIGPIFFVTLGSKLIFHLEIFQTVITEALILFVSLFIGQISSAALAARFTGKFSWPDSLMIGFGMLGRAELAFVVMNIAFVQYKIMSIEAFYTLMLTAFLLNVSVPLTIRWWKSKFL